MDKPRNLYDDIPADGEPVETGNPNYVGAGIEDPQTSPLLEEMRKSGAFDAAVRDLSPALDVDMAEWRRETQDIAGALPTTDPKARAQREVERARNQVVALDVLAAGPLDQSYGSGYAPEHYAQIAKYARIALFEAQQTREQTEQTKAVPRDQATFGGEMARGLMRGFLGTGPEMIGTGIVQWGKSSESEGLEGAGEVLRYAGKEFRKEIPAQSAPQFTDLGVGVSIGAPRVLSPILGPLSMLRFGFDKDATKDQREYFWRDFRQAVGNAIGEGIGTSAAFLLTGAGGRAIAGKIGQWLGGVGAGVAMGHGQMRQRLEEEFAKQGSEPDEALMERYVYTFGTAIGMLEYLTEMRMLRALGPDQKKIVGDLLAKRIAERAAIVGKEAALGMVMEGTTEALQDITEILGTNMAFARPMDWEELRKTGINSFLGGAFPGGVFGTVGGAREAYAAKYEPQKPAGTPPAPAAPTEPDAVEQPPTATLGDGTPEFQPMAARKGRKREPQPGFNPYDAPEPTLTAPESEPVRALRAQLAKVNRKAKLAAVAEEAGFELPDSVLGGTLAQIREAIIDAAKAARGEAAPVAQPVQAPVTEPSFQDVRSLLPRDETGDPDVGKLAEMIQLQTGKPSWASLSPDEKRDVAASFGWQAPAPEVAPAPAEPAASQAPAAPLSGAKQAFLDRLDTIKRKKDLVDGAAQIGIKIDKTTAKRSLADIRKAIRAKAGNSIAATPSQEVKPQEGERGPDNATARAPVREGEGGVSEGRVPGIRREDGEGEDAGGVSQGTGRDGGRDGGAPARADDDAAGPAERDVPGTATEVQPDSARGGRDRQKRDPLRDAVAAELAAQEQARIDRRRRNYRITDADEVGKGGAKTKVRANIAAIETLKRIEDEGREATDDERKVLVKYVGWGAFAQDVFADHKPDWAKERQQLKDMLTAEEYASARRSTMNAHYTSPEVIKGIWQALDHLGFTGGRVLEPSAGIGHFIGLQPDHLIGQNEWTAVELDTLTGRMLKALHSGSDVRVQGFQDYKVPDNFFDLAISNVPFEKTGPHDPRYKTPLSLHDYFFVKSLDKVRPGGLVAFVTSSYTLDKVRDRARQMIADRADFVGAIRLPGGSRGAFKANAGTDVTTDVIFLRKRQPGEAPSDTTWLDIQDIRTPEGPTPVNAYYAQNPEMMLGKMRLTGSQWSAGEPVLIGSTENLDQKITEAAQNMPANVFLPRGQSVVTNETLAVDTNTDGIKEGAFYVKDGKIYRKVMGVGQAYKISQADARKVTALIGVRDIVNEMLAKQARGDKTGMGDLRRRLGAAYDAFVKKNGPINKLIVSTSTRTNKAGQPIVTRRMPNFSAFSEDPDAYKVAAIEAYDEESGAARKTAIFFEDIVGSYQAPEITGPVDALAVSLNETGKIDIPLMAERLGLSEAEVIADLGNAVFLNPNGDTWQRASDYLSGDVVRKLEEAREAAAADARYERNVEALEAVQPPPLTQIDIRVNFGAPWIPKEDYQAFLREALGAYNPEILYSQVSKTWYLGDRTSFPQSAQARFGTDRVSVEKIVEAAINGKPIQVKDKLSDGSSVVNDAATQEAQAKVQALLDTFQGNPDAAIEPWLWQDEARAERLEKIYNAAFNRLVKTTYDGSHLTLPGMATSLALSDGRVVPFSLRPHQKNAVWRMVVSGNTLLDHTVGAGKTFTMIAGAMELKRLGLVQRPMFVVPNHMLEQFSREFLQAYPGAKLLVATKKQMSKARRKEFAARVAADKWDGIIITHSSFGRIGVSPEAEVAYLESELAELREVLDTAEREDGKKAKTVKEIEKAISKREERMKKLMASERKDEGVTFEELGVDHVIVDEAHAYKNLPVFTKHTRIKGIGTKPSQRATDLFMKIRILEAAKPGRSVTFATGTPMSRSMAELFTMQRYLQLETLKEYGIEQFDAWAATFGRIVTKSELAIDGRGLKETTSFSKFVNIPELVAIYSQVADTMSAADLNLPRPTLAGGKVQIETVDLNDASEQKVQEIIRGIESLKGVRPKKGDPNHLSYFTKGLQVSTDLRLLDPSAPFDPNGKIGKVISNVFDIWKNGKKPALAQMIFLDMGVPSARTKAKSSGPVEEDASQIDTVRAKLLGEDVAEAEDAEELTEDDLEDAEIEAQLEGAFNLYDDIREHLVARGVPREQIAFIHEAPTDEKKALLFKEVREGKVRIIIGSSGKMGVGTNVQKYLVAMHHVDAPWNPADVEQRDGRILRQGNENKEVSIFRYVTKRSFEAYRWQLLDRKAQFVADFRAGARGVREAEDIDSPLPEASELKAAATGNPYIMEFADLTKEVRDLENAKRASERSVYQAKRSLESTRADLEQSKKYEAAYAEDAKKVVDLAGKAFKATLSVGPKPGQEVTERKDLGEIVRNYIVEQGRYIYSSTPQSRTVGEISGFPIKVEIRSSGEGLQVQFGIDGAAQYRSSGGYMLMTGEANPVVIAQRIEGLVRGVPVLLQQARDKVAKAEADIPRLERQSRPVAFPREARLQEAKARLDEVKKLLNPPKEGEGPAEKAVMAALIGDAKPPDRSLGASDERSALTTEGRSNPGTPGHQAGATIAEIADGRVALQLKYVKPQFDKIGDATDALAWDIESILNAHGVEASFSGSSSQSPSRYITVDDGNRTFKLRISEHPDRHGSDYTVRVDGLGREQFADAASGQRIDAEDYNDLSPSERELYDFVGVTVDRTDYEDAVRDGLAAVAKFLRATPPMMAALAPQEQRRVLDDLGFYSQALEAARAWPQKKGTVEQALKYLEGQGVKKAEIETTGLAQALEGKPSITRDELVKVLEEGRVGLEEVRHSREEDFDAEVQVRMEEWRDETIARGKFEEVARRDELFWDSEKAVVDATDFVIGEGAKLDRQEVLDAAEVPGATLYKDAGVYVTEGEIGVWSDYNGPFFIVEAPNKRAIVLSRFESNPEVFQSKADAISFFETEARAVVNDILATAGDVEARLRETIQPNDPTRWSRYSLDPSNPTYSETVVHLPNETDRLDFRSGHFPEPNIVGHMMTSMTLHKGKPVYTLDQIQSDWSQKIRDATREAVAQKLYQKRFEDLLPAERSAVSKEIDAATKRGERPAGVRDEKKIAELKARLDAWRYGLSSDEATNWRVAVHKFGKDKGLNVGNSIGDHVGMRENIERLSVRQDTLGEQAREFARTDPLGEDSKNHSLLRAELRTAEAASPGHPLVNTTDQWVRTTLRQALRQAAEADAEYIAIPSGQTVLSYNPGKEEGMVGFYDKIVPTSLKKIIKGEPINVETLDSPSGKTGLGKGFTLFPLTPELKARILGEGQPMFAIKDDKAERDAFKAKLEAGKTATVKKSVQEGMRGFLQKAPALLPPGSPIGFMKRAKAIGNGRASVTYELQDGTTLSKELEVSFLLGSWAFFDPDSGFIGFHRLAFSPDLVGTLSGQLYHEVLHWLRTNGLLRGATWRRLLDHATRLRVLDMKWRTYLQVRGDPHYVRVTDGRTVGEMYAAAYQHIQDFDKINEYLDQESVAIMLEVHALGIPLSGMEQLSDILMAIDNGSMARGDYSPRSLGVSPEDTMTPGMWTHLAINAWHGSPHDFDRFSMDHIGSGEGAQAFGHGLYFAESKRTAEWYQASLASPPSLSKVKVIVDGVTHDAKAFIDLLSNEIERVAGAKVWGTWGPGDVAFYLVERLNAGGWRSPASAVREWSKGAPQGPLRDAYEAIARVLDKSTVEAAGGGHLYEVRLDVDHVDLLDWDKPLSQQPEKVRRVLENLIDVVLPGYRNRGGGDAPVAAGQDGGSPVTRRAAQARQAIRTALGTVGMLKDASTVGGWFNTSPEAAKALREAGIPGIRYLDQGSRGAGEGTRNIVIFDDSLVEIISKDGKPVSKAERAQVIEQMKGEQSGLDMSPEARKARAEEMGFDTSKVWYHGSTKDFDQFDPKKANRANGIPRAIFLAEDKATANYFARSQDGSRVLPVYVRRGNYFDFRNSDDAAALAAFLEGKASTDIVPGYLGSPRASTFVDSMRRGDWGILERPVVQKWLKSRGYKGWFASEREGAPLTIAILDPSNIRSVNAAFDPAESASSKLMAALGPQQQRPAATAIASGEALREEMEASGMVTEEGAPVLFGLDEVPEIDPEAVESDPGRVDTFVSWWSLEDDAKAVVREITGFDETYAADWIEPHIGLRILNGPDGKPMMAHLDVRDPFSVLIDVPESATRGRAPVLPSATVGSIQANAIVGGPRLQGARTPRPGPGAEQPLNSIADLVTKFNKALGLTTRVGRLDPRLKAAAGRAGGKLFGQFSTRTGVVRLRLANDFDVLTHEGGHSLETRLGRSLEALKQKHRSELEPLATTLIGQKLSEGFAEFFRLYITNPTFAQRAAPKFLADFEALLGQQASLLPAKRGAQRTMLDDIADVQSAYENYLIAPSQGRTVRNQVLVHRMGGVRAFLDKVTETGFVRAFTDRAHRLYDYLVASDHSWYMATRKLLDLAEANTGQRIDLRAIDNPGKLFRRLSHTKSWAMADMLRGVMLPGHTDPSGPSLSEALSDAFGGQEVGKWTEAAFKDFGQYLIARRAILLYVRHNSRLARTVQNFVQQNPSLQYLLAKLPAPGGFDLPAPPTAESLLDHLNTVRDLEASHPSYRAAADKVYAFNRNILTLLRHAGLLSDAQYQHYTTAETDWVPFARDMRDEGALQDPLQGPSGMATDLSQVNKRSILGRIKGSSRPIINPIQSLMQYVFEVRLRVATNETVKALADLAAGAGAGPSGFAGAIFEPLPANEARAMQVKVFDALRSAAKDAGMTDIDTDVMLANVETYLDKNAVTTLFTMGQAKEAGEPIVWYWQDGKPIPGRLGDGDLGRLMFLSLTSSGQRSSSFLLKAAAMPAIMVRTGATKWFDFIFANLIRDAFATAANSPFAWPFYTQFQGLREVLTGGKYLHMYEHYAGMMGGELTQAIEDSSIERDIDALRKEGVRVVRVTDFRTFLKAAGQYGKAALQWSEFSETATRVGVFKAAYDRAIADGLTPGEAVYEAAHEAHDIIDFSRHGSKTEVIRRVIPFWNAWLQGTTKYVRALTAQSDQGNAFIKWRNGEPLTRAEQVDLERSMKAWAWTFVGLGTFSLIVAALNAGDDDMDEVSDRVRATHWVIKLQGALHLIPKSWDVFGLAEKGKDIKVRIPKPFEVAWFANAVERAFDGAAKADPKAFQRWLHDFWEITSPPSGVTALDTAYGLRAGEDFFTGRSIVPFWEAQEERPDQFGPYTSETAKRIGKLLNVSPYYVDNVIRGLGASMGRDLTALADRHLFGKDGAPTPRLDEIVIARRFLQNPAKGSRSISEFFDLYRGRGGFSGWFWDTFSEGARSYYAAAKRYKDALDSGRDAQAAEYLASFTDDQKAYALLMSKRGRGAAGYRALHPLENTRIFVEQSNAILKEMLMDGISTGSRKPGAPKKFIDLDPAQKGIIRHELMQARMAAAQNGLRILGVDGWAQRQPLDMGVRLEVVRQASQEVYDELQRRLKKKHFLPFEGVARTWKATRDRLVSDGRNAVLGDLKADAATQ